MEDSISMEFRFAYKKLMHKQIIPHSCIPKKVATNYVSIYVNINNFITLKRFQVRAIKHVFLSALMEQQGPLLLCTYSMLNGNPHASLQINYCSYHYFIMQIEVNYVQEMNFLKGVAGCTDSLQTKQQTIIYKVVNSTWSTCFKQGQC